MKKCFSLVMVASAFAMSAFAQAADSPFQISTVAELDRGEAYITLSNSGASSTVAFPTQNGSLCANLYVYAPDATQLACCSCLIPANGLVSAAVKNSLLSLAPNRPLLIAPSVVVKVMASTGTGGVCNASTVGTGANVLATGMLAWSTTLTIAGTDPPSFFPTKHSFTPSTLSAAELVRATSICANNQTLGGANICKGCQLGGH